MIEKYQIKLEEEISYFKELIRSSNFLNSQFNLEGYQVIHNMNQAIDLYQSEEPPKGYYIYLDIIQENEYSGFVPYSEKFNDKLDMVWDEVRAELWSYIDNQLMQKNRILENLSEFVYVDFLNIIAYKASNGSQNIFLEKQIEAYQNGGFPCGWKGEYPEGEMVVYSPK